MIRRFCFCLCFACLRICIAFVLMLVNILQFNVASLYLFLFRIDNREFFFYFDFFNDLMLLYLNLFNSNFWNDFLFFGFFFWSLYLFWTGGCFCYQWELIEWGKLGSGWWQHFMYVEEGWILCLVWNNWEKVVVSGGRELRHISEAWAWFREEAGWLEMDIGPD